SPSTGANWKTPTRKTLPIMSLALRWRNRPTGSPGPCPVRGRQPRASASGAEGDGAAGHASQTVFPQFGLQPDDAIHGDREGDAGGRIVEVPAHLLEQRERAVDLLVLLDDAEDGLIPRA